MSCELKQKAKTWLCSQVLLVLGETDTTLRRKLELGQVKLDAAYYRRINESEFTGTSLGCI